MQARLLETDLEVQELAATLAGEPLIGVDTEADSFHSYLPKVCLVQVSTRTADYIIDPLAAGDLSPLAGVLADPSVTCVLHGSDYDIRILDRDHGLRVEGLFDTMVAARLLGYESFGLSSLLERHFGLKVSKAAQRADWSRRPLSANLLRYAATDTHHLPALHDILRGELENAGRLEWALEEFALLEKLRHEPREPDPEAYLRIKGARSLDRRGLAVLREVFELREQRAREQDRAPFRVLGNAALLELARRRPTRPRELAGIPGLPRNLSAARGQEMVEAIRRALDLKEEELPVRRRSPKGPRPQPNPQLPALKRIREQVAREVSLDPSLVAPNALLEAIASARPTDRESLLDVPGIRHWQADLLATPILSILTKKG
jgi:ribonuclease D